MFSMIGDSKDINKKGTGLGLYISNSLAKYLAPKGSNGIEFNSQFVEGTIFNFVLENKVKEIDYVVHNIPRQF